MQREIRYQTNLFICIISVTSFPWISWWFRLQNYSLSLFIFSNLICDKSKLEVVNLTKCCIKKITRRVYMHNKKKEYKRNFLLVSKTKSKSLELIILPSLSSPTSAVSSPERLFSTCKENFVVKIC